jgi:DNA repair exonuclease SbcCD ATPase subunit
MGIASMNENLEDNGQFKMRLDEELDEASMPTDVDNLRIEKLSHRMTMITILIPVLLVVVLVIAYLDIKKRVIRTEDTGQLTAENLSKDLESRFEKLTMAQRVIEENLARLKDQSNQSVAKVQINLKKLDDRMKSTGRKMASRKDMKATTDKLGKNVANIAQSMEDLKLQVGQLNETLQPGLSELRAALDENKSQLDQLGQQLSALDQAKIDKASMDLALKLEILKIKQAYKAQMEDLLTRLKSLEKKVARQAAAPAPSPSKPAPSQSAPSPAPGTIEEQTIGK